MVEPLAEAQAQLVYDPAKARDVRGPLWEGHARSGWEDQYLRDLVAGFYLAGWEGRIYTLRVWANSLASSTLRSYAASYRHLLQFVPAALQHLCGKPFPVQPYLHAYDPAVVMEVLDLLVGFVVDTDVGNSTVYLAHDFYCSAVRFPLFAQVLHCEEAKN